MNDCLEYVIVAAKQRLSPPQYYEFLGAMNGKGSEPTINYWRGIALQWLAVAVENNVLTPEQVKQFISKS